MENEYAGKEVEIEIYAEAVQKLEVIAAMKSAWGVVPELNSQGEITQIND